METKQLPQVSNTTFVDGSEINNTFKLLEEGEGKIYLKEQYKNLSLVIGNTGAGKSTFIQWIAGDDSKLISTEVVKDSGEFIIEDGNRISNDTITSKTFFPELVVHNKTNSAYYDCPGFSDTRSTSHDIASTYFIKKVVDYADSVKIILVVSYPSVKKGVSRYAFMTLMKHVTDFIKNIGKFKSSIALIVTKVDTQYVKKGRNLFLVSDETVILAIVKFLQEVKQNLEDRLNHGENSPQKRFLYKGAIELLSILLKENKGTYESIGIFRRPDEPGPLNEITLLLEGKEHVEKILHEKLHFTEKNNNDFGYTISDKSKNDINILVEKINQKVWFDISEIVDEVKNHYGNLIGEMRGRIKPFVDKTQIADVTETEAEVFTTLLNTGSNVISRLLTECKNLTTVSDLAKTTNSSLTRLGIDDCKENIKNIRDQGNFFNFLQAVSDRQLNISPEAWSSLFQQIEIYLSDSKKGIDNNVREASDKINRAIDRLAKNIARNIEEHYRIKMEKLEIGKLPTELSKGFLLISQLINQADNLNNAQEISEKISDAIIKLDFSCFAKIESDMLSILYHGKYLDFLKILNNGVLNTWSLEWIVPFKNTSKHLSESETWYTFLNHLYAKFSDYEMQRYKKEYNVANINDWGIKNKSQGIQISKNNFKTFLEKIKKYNIQEWEAVKNLEVTELQLNELNHVLGLTLKNNMRAECPEPGKLVIRGDFIKFSDFGNNDAKVVEWLQFFCNYKISSVDIFALDTVIIDRDFNGVGSKLKLSVVAPKWQIEGYRKINLNGADGIKHSPPKADKGQNPGGRGNNGKRGLTGGSGGHFLGIANEFINGGSLTITANGGLGGPGQDGGDGGDGYAGRDARVDDEKVFIRDDKIITVFYNEVIEQYMYYGKSGGYGGNGGNGGTGGLGGMKGRIEILKLNNSSDVPTAKSSQGSDGMAGKGGRGGKGGKNGNHVKRKYCKKFATFVPVQLDWCGSEDIENTSSAGAGSNGQDGLNSSGRQPTEIETPFQNVADTLNAYKIFLRENLSDRFKKHSLMRFAVLLDGNADIKNSYATLELVNELRTLEKQVYSSHELNKDNFIYFYHSIRNRTNEYAQTLKSSVNQKNFQVYKKVLNHLYLATFSGIYHLRDDSYPNLIINIEQNLDLVKRDFDDLRNFQQKNNKVTAINQYKENFKSAINDKLGEAKSFINDQLLPEIDIIHIQIGNKIALLINETIILQEQAGENMRELIQKKRELETTSIISSILSGFKFIGRIVGLFGGIGSTIGAITELGSDIGESVALKANVISDIQSLKSDVIELKRQQTFHFDYGKTSTDFYVNYTRNKGKRIKTIDDAIEQAKISIQKLDQYESHIQKTIIPLLENMVKDLDYVASQLNKKSKISLQVTKWQVTKALEDMKLLIRQFTKDFSVQENLARCIENLEEVMVTLIGIYGCIQDYQYQKQLADYLAEIASPNDSNIDITDAELRKAISDLDIITKSNLVLNRYKIAVDAFMQHVFPLAHLYLAQPMLPFHLELEYNRQDFIDTATKQVDIIQSKIKAYKTSITQQDYYMKSGWFSSDFESTKPFFVWRNEKHRDTISNLLLGKKVVLESNILNSHPDKDAIKFNMIGINLHSPNSSISSSQIRNKIKKYTINITHLGNSYYRLNDKIYAITTSSQNIQYSFEKDTLGNPVHKNRAYDKMKSGDLILSPYAMWEIQLINPSIIPYEELEMYKDQIDLELVGYGCYLAKGHNISNLQVDNYYKKNEVLSGIGYINQLEYQMNKNESQVQKSLLSSKDNPPQKPIHRHSRRRKCMVPEADLSPTNRFDTATSGGNSLQFWPINFLKKIGSTFSSCVSGMLPETTNKHHSKRSPPPHSLLSSGQPVKPIQSESPYTGSMVLDMGDQWLKSIYINDLLIWGVFFVRKWTGYRPAEKMFLDGENKDPVDLEIRSARLADEYIQTVLEHAAACGIRPNVYHLLQDNELPYKLKKIIRQKLSVGELESIPQLLYKQQIQPNINKLSLNTTRAQANRFSYSIKDATPNILQQFLQQEQRWLIERQQPEKSEVSSVMTNAKKGVNLAMSTKAFPERLFQHCQSTRWTGISVDSNEISFQEKM